MKGMAAPQPTNPVVYFSLEDFDAATYATLSQGLQAVIAKSPEFQKITNGHSDDDGLPEQRPGDEDDLSSIPF